MKRWNNWSILGGLTFIGLGVLIFVGQVFHIDLISRLWPLFIVAVGGLFFYGMASGGRDNGGMAIPGSVITTVGLILLFQNLTGLWASWAYAWTLIIAAAGVGLLIFSYRSDIPELRIVGRIVITVGLVLFFVFGFMFELGASLFGLRSPGGLIWPVMLILLGLYVLVGRPLFARWMGPVSRSSVNFSNWNPGGAVIEGEALEGEALEGEALEGESRESEPVTQFPMDQAAGAEVRAGAELRGLSGVKRLDFHGIGDVVVVQGEREGLEIEASQTVKDHLIVQVRGDTLEIRFKQDWWDWMTPTSWNLGRIRFTWYVRELASIHAAGLGNIEGSTLSAQRLELRHSGSGGITLRRIAVKNLLVDLSGLGSIRLDGQADWQEVTLSGTGSYEARELESRAARVNLSGLGSARVLVLEELDGQVSGAGSIEYRGNPRVSQHVSGLGSIHQVR